MTRDRFKKLLLDHVVNFVAHGGVNSPAGRNARSQYIVKLLRSIADGLEELWYT